MFWKRLGVIFLFAVLVGVTSPHEALAGKSQAICGGQGNDFVEQGSGRKVSVSEYVNTVMGENTWRTRVRFDGGEVEFEVFGRWKKKILDAYDRLIDYHGDTIKQRRGSRRNCRLHFQLYNTEPMPGGYGYAGTGWCIEIAW
jgi:hypothetical protein